MRKANTGISGKNSVEIEKKREKSRKKIDYRPNNFASQEKKPTKIYEDLLIMHALLIVPGEQLFPGIKARFLLFPAAILYGG